MLEINEESLHNKLLEHKNHIGFNCAEGSLIIASGLAFVYTIVSGKINNNILNIVSWCFAIGQIIYGLAQVIIALKTKFNAEKLYREIVKLDVSAHRYSLIAIKDSFMGYKSNRILTKYFEGKWNEYMFLSFPTAAERDEESLKNAIGAALKIPRDVIHLYQKASIYQPKISQDWNTVRAYYNTYYVVYIDSFPELLKNNEFEIDGVHYKWMTLEQMEREAEKKEHNKNERRTFARYIFTPARYTDLYSEPRKNVWKMPHNVCIRLNRKCDLSCKFCLACSENTLMLSTDVVKQCLCLLKNNGVRRARLGGGEPTRHPGFMEIVRYSVNLGMDTIVYSNLYDVDKIIPELIKYPIRVVTSLHGDESFHDFITQTEGAYQRTYNNIVKLVSYNIPVTIHMVLMNENVHMVEQVVVEAIKIGVDKVTIQTLIPRERGREFLMKSTHNRRERPVHGHRGGSRGRFYYRITTFEGRPWDARDPYKTTFMALKHEIRLSIWRKQKETPGVEKAPGVSSPQRKESGRSGRDDGELRFWVRPGHPYKAVTSISQAEALAHGLTHLHHLVFAAVLARELDWCAALQDAREDARPWGVVGIGLRSDVWVEVRRDDHRPAVLVT